MVIGEGNLKYNWIENWVTIPDSKTARDNGRTHGVSVTRDGNIIVFCQADPAVLMYNGDGKLLEVWGDRFSGAHGLTLVEENGKEFTWLTDEFSTEVVKTTLSGDTVLSIDKPRLAAYETEKYSPTWVAVFEEDKGGNGDIWVADGYGSSFVHRYSKEGIYISSLTGEEGAGRFECPHSLFFDYRKSEPELYIADRGNKRFQVYDAEGNFKREFGKGILDLPCGGKIFEGLLYVPELNARVTLLDEDDKLVAYLGRNEQTLGVAGWPNHKKELIAEGKFNSPHDLAVDRHGNIFVVEWIIGGRVTKLEKLI